MTECVGAVVWAGAHCPPTMQTSSLPPLGTLPLRNTPPEGLSFVLFCPDWGLGSHHAAGWVKFAKDRLSLNSVAHAGDVFGREAFEAVMAPLQDLGPSEDGGLSTGAKREGCHATVRAGMAVRQPETAEPGPPAPPQLEGPRLDPLPGGLVLEPTLPASRPR